MKETKEFIELQKQLLKAKKAYYHDDVCIMSDYEYDMLEKQSFDLAKSLGFNADKWEGPEENEEHHIHWMVGYLNNSIYN